LAQSALAQVIGGRVKDFVAPSVDPNGKKSVLKGADARHVGNRVYQIEKPVVTVRNPDGSLDMVIEAVECFFNQNTQLASSTNSLSVKTGADKFSITGKGWKWEAPASRLAISNDVVALVKKSAVLTNNAAANSAAAAHPLTNAPIRITSRAFAYETDLARFMQNVKVVDDQGTVFCDLLELFFEKEGGAKTIEALDHVIIEQGETRAKSGKAIYDVARNTLTLTNHPQWELGGRSGTSDSLLIDRTNQIARADGSVYMKIPRAIALPQTNQAAQVQSVAAAPKKLAPDEFVEIFADHFEFQQSRNTNQPGVARYTGKVRVVQPQGELRCRQLTIYFTPVENKLFRAIAEQEVEVSRADGVAKGSRAEYELADEKITMTGNPIWQFGERNGSSKILVFYPRSDELYALEKVEMTMPASEGNSGLSLSNAKPSSDHAKQPGGTNQLLRITSQVFSHKDGLSVFGGDVLVKDRQGEIASELLTVIAGASNQVERIIADKNVTIRQPEMIAAGKQAIYYATTGIVELTGDPMISAPDKRVKADIFWINREKNTFSFRGNYKIEFAQQFRGEHQPMALFPGKEKRPAPKKSK
jgi:lipopolysaccharide export system protein LptA